MPTVRPIIIANRILRILIFRRSIHKNASLLLTRIANGHIPRNRLIHLPLFVILHSTKLVQLVKNVSNDRLRPRLVMAALVDQNLLEFGADVLDDELTLGGRDDFVLLAVEEDDWDFEIDVFLE